MPRQGKSQAALPLPVKRALKKLGGDIADARKRRRLTAALVAERALISRGTLRRIESGDPGASLGNVATVLFVLGLADRIGDLIDVTADPYLPQAEAERLPQRVRAKK
jgi:transcriptional regulator with XRE-family HTH domain